MKKIVVIPGAVLFFLSLFYGCGKENDQRITKKFQPGKFNTIVIKEACTVYLVSDTACSVELKGPADWIDRSTVELDDTSLIISPSHHGEFLHPSKELIEVYVHYDSLKRINTEESCTIRTSTPLAGNEIGLVSSSHMIDVDFNLACNIFYFWNIPNGTHMKLSGQVDQLKLWNTGLSTVDAKQVIANYVLVDNGSQGDVHVSPQQTLDYKINNKGNIYYSGSPSTIIQQTGSGSGRLIQE